MNEDTKQRNREYAMNLEHNHMLQEIEMYKKIIKILLDVIDDERKTVEDLAK